MAVADVAINIATEFTGKKGFKQAETATDKLSKGVKNLAKTLGLAFGATAILAYSKASIKAAAEDEKAQKQLALALNNVGLGRDAASSEAYIQGLQSEFGILDDKLRPAYQQLAVAVRDSGEAQRLLNLSLDISASTGKELGSVTSALSKAFLGNNTALSKLGVGISKTDLKAKSFKKITDELEITFAGAATAAVNTFSGSMDKLTVATANAQETIGKGLIDALIILSGDTGIGSVTTAIDEMSLAISESIVTTAKLVKELEKIPLVGTLIKNILGNPLSLPDEFLVFGKGGLLDSFRDYKKIADLQKATDNAHLKALQNQFPVITKITKLQKETTKLTKEQAAAAKLKLVTDKAQLALGKGEGVFDIEAIQFNAALINQAEQLGKTTNQAQLLAIANDVARLNVKKSMLDLEAAIASGDIKAIEAATAKLNKDLQILGTLSGQAVKLQDIKSILDSLKPKDLINQANLDEALRKIREIMAMMAAASVQSTAKIPTSASLGSGIPAGDFIAPISTAGGSIEAILEYADAATARANAFADLLDIQNRADTTALIEYQRSVGDFGGYSPTMNSGGSQTPIVNVYANTIASPDELTNLIQDAVIRLNKRGDYITTAGAL